MIRSLCRHLAMAAAAFTAGPAASRASCAWTPYINDAVEQLKANGFPVTDELLAGSQSAAV